MVDLTEAKPDWLARMRGTQAGRKEWIRDAEARGEVADSIAVRQALLARVAVGEITLKDAQAELERIKRGAAKAGKITREQAFDMYTGARQVIVQPTEGDERR